MKTRYLSPGDQAREATLKSELWELLVNADPDKIKDPDWNLDVQMIEDELEAFAVERFRAWLRDYHARAKRQPRGGGE